MSIAELTVEFTKIKEGIHMWGIAQGACIRFESVLVQLGQGIVFLNASARDWFEITAFCLPVFQSKLFKVMASHQVNVRILASPKVRLHCRCLFLRKMGSIQVPFILEH